MGITGLLPFLDKATRPCHISEFRGGTVAVDSYCWLHKGANACAEQLARGEDNQQYVTFCLKYVKMLLSYDIQPIMVFDGRNLPAKAETETKRREARKKAKQRGAELLRLGKVEEARTYLKQCIDITPKMANNLIRECRKLNVDCIVAPYESDAQLAFFNTKGIAEVIITEDSDLLLFGCKKVLYKLDLNGAGQLIEAEKINLSMKMRPDQYSFDKFLHMCIMSGCDYVSSLPGIGLKKSLKFLNLTVETNPLVYIDKLPRYLNMRNLAIPEDYKEKFMIAEATFRHQTVFDPFKRKLVPLTDPDLAGTKPEHCKNAGTIFDHDTAYQIALGNLNPNNLEKIDDWTPPFVQGPSKSIWSGVYKKRVSKKQQQEDSKQHMSKFLEANVKVLKISSKSEIEEQKIKELEDEQLENELAMYRNPKPRKSDADETPEKQSEPVEDTERLSPVIKKNPFLSKKKLSKFSVTQTDCKTIVKSRYFVKPSEINIETTVNEETPEEVEEKIVTEESEDNSESKQLSQQSNTENETDNVAEENCKKRSNDDIIDITEDLKECKTETSCSSKESKSTADVKRRKLGPCKFMGLQKKGCNQKTIQQFFFKVSKSMD